MKRYINEVYAHITRFKTYYLNAAVPRNIGE